MIINGNALSIPLADKSVHCIVTSPPYFHMRDYGVIGQLGDERTPEEFISNLVAVFAEVYRVSRADSTLWLNISDSYAGSAADRASKLYGVSKTKLLKEWGYHTKEELDIPHRLANAIRSIGWQKRCTVIWNKPNPMPESVTDRPTKAHEYLFLMTKQERYYYDAEAVREDNSPTSQMGGCFKGDKKTENVGNGHSGLKVENNTWSGRNRRTVWTIPTAPYKGAHFATYPPALVEPCIKAGTSERGVCPKCGKGWRRVIKTHRTFESGSGKSGNLPTGKNGKNLQGGGETVDIRRGPVVHNDTTGWLPACTCDGHFEKKRVKGSKDADYYVTVETYVPDGEISEPIPAIVFDPFAGSGTTVKVAFDLGRRGVGLDLSLEYLDKQATKRIHNGHTGRLI